MLFEQFLAERDAIDATQHQLQKAQRKAQKYTDKANAARYDIKFKQDKLEYERKKDALQREIDGKSDPVQKEISKAALRDLEKDWQAEKEKYKSRIKSLNKAARISAGGAAMP